MTQFEELIKSVELYIYNKSASSTLLKNREDEYKIILHCLYKYNMRISELLSCDETSIINDRYIVIKGKKKSRDIIIYEDVLIKAFKSLLAINKISVFSVNYYQVYSYIKRTERAMIIKSVGGNDKVTHAPRYRNAQELQSAGVTEKTLQTVLHHNSKKSQKYYLKKGDSNGKNLRRYSIRS